MKSGWKTMVKTERCFWCNSDPEENARRHERPHSTWCPRFRTGEQIGRGWYEFVVMADGTLKLGLLVAGEVKKVVEPETKPK